MREAFLALADEYFAKIPDCSDADHVELLERLVGKETCARIGIYRIPESFLLSVVIPVYNEAATIGDVIDRVRGAELPCEMVIVDDGSTDRTRDILRSLKTESGAKDLKILFHEKNRGKGAALRTGFAHVSGDVIVVQDADMEYDPRDFRLLLQPILEDRADVVYGSRFTLSGLDVLPQWHRRGNQLITYLCNLSTGLRFSDVETCYKMLRRDCLERIAPTLQEEAFGVEIEMTAKLAKLKDVRFYERPISYVKRSYREGKKIGLRDAVRAVWCMIRY